MIKMITVENDKNENYARKYPFLSSYIFESASEPVISPFFSEDESFKNNLFSFLNN